MATVLYNGVRKGEERGTSLVGLPSFIAIIILILVVIFATWYDENRRRYYANRSEHELQAKCEGSNDPNKD